MSRFTEDQKSQLRARIMTYRSGAKKRIPDEMVEIDYKVLQDAVGSLTLPAEPNAPSEDWNRRDVDNKMDYNHLTGESRDIINASIVYSSEVENFVRVRAANGDEDFPERLSGFFKGVYAEYNSNGLEGDDLFDALHLHLEEKVKKRSARKASVAILAHLFEKCEVFEK